RHALYERARASFFAHLPGAALSEADIVAHRLSLEQAIRRVEAESARAVSLTTERRGGMKPTEFAHSEAPASKALPFLGISLAIRALRGSRLRRVLTARKHVLLYYYPPLPRPLSFPTRRSSDLRHALYERARAAFFAHLPAAALSEADIVAHRLSLEQAIRTVETESIGRASCRDRGHSGVKPTELDH